MNTRTKTVVGEDNLKKIESANLLIFGVGGVGGFVAEMFVRMGVKNLTIVDFDKVDKTNLNRQIVSLESNIGKNKVDVFYDRAKNINPSCNIVKVNEKLTKGNISKFFIENFDYVIDCIDDVSAKVFLAKYCYENEINLISSMGTGNRYKGIPHFEVTDIYKTSYDKLAKKIREELKKEGVKKLQVVYTKQPPEKTEGLGSVVYYPLMCAGTIVGFVINEILK